VLAGNFQHGCRRPLMQFDRLVYSTIERLVCLEQAQHMLLMRAGKDKLSARLASSDAIELVN